MKRKLLRILSITAIVLGLLFVVSCNGCNGCAKKGELKSSAGITLVGGNFERGAKLVTEKVETSDESVKKALGLLPEKYSAFEETDVAAIDISVLKNGVKLQPDGKVKVTVPAPIKGVSDYVVFHVKSETEVEELDCDCKDGQVSFETDSFSTFLFGDASTSKKITIKVEKSCNGNVVVKAPETFVYSSFPHYLENGEEKDFYVKKYRTVKLEAIKMPNYYFAGWFKEKDGVTEAEPFSKDLKYEFYVEEEQTIVAKFHADLNGVYQIWNFPGESNFPVGFSDGRAAREIYIKPGNAKNFDVNGLVLKGLKRDPKTNKLVYVKLSPDQYTVTGLDKVEYDKEGEYRVDYELKGEGPATSIYVCVSEKNAELKARSTYGGCFRVREAHGSDKYTYYNYKEFTVTNMDKEFALEAEARYWGENSFRKSEFEFDGWYVLLEGGVIGDKLSDEKIFNLNEDLGDLTVLAVFKIQEKHSKLDSSIYQLSVRPGESGLPNAIHNGKPLERVSSFVYFKPGAPEIDLLKLEMFGLHRIDKPNNPYEYVPLYIGDYTVDYGGLDFRTEGRYNVTYTLTKETSSGGYVKDSITVYVSEKFAKLTLEFEGEGKLEVTRYDEKTMTESGVKETFGYFSLGDFRTITAIPNAGHTFIGWYSVDEDGNLSEQPVSRDAEYSFVQKGKDEHLKAVFKEEVLSLTLDVDGFENGNFDYNLTTKEKPDLSKLSVTSDKGTKLEAADYTVDASKVNYLKTGVYEITVTYKYDEKVKAKLTVTVPKAEAYLYRYDPDREGIIKAGDDIAVSSPDGRDVFLDLGSSLTLTAVPGDGDKFYGWYIADSSNGERRFYSSNVTETFVITDNIKIYARFEEKEKVVFTVIAGDNGHVCEYKEQGGTSLEKQLRFVSYEGAKVKVSASVDMSYIKFVGWYDGEGENAALISKDETYEFTVTEEKTVYARFDYSFFVGAIIEGGGEFKDLTYVTENGFFRGDLPLNTEVTIEVKEKAGYRFVGWFVSADRYTAEGLLSTQPKHTFVVNEQTGNLHLTALFRANVTEIKLADDPDCGFYVDNDGKLVTEYLVRLNGEFYAHPEELPVLGKAGGEYQELILGAEYRIDSTILYNENGLFDTSKTGVYTITYTYIPSPELKAVITVKVAEIFNFLAQCQPSPEAGKLTENGVDVKFGNGRAVEKGTKITLTAVASNEYDFKGWYRHGEDQSEILISADATHTFTVDKDTYVYAKFEQKEMCTFFAYPTEAGRIIENGVEVEFTESRKVIKGTKITLTAEAKEQGYRFVGWYNSSDQSETLISADATYTFTVDKNMSVYLKFEQLEMCNFFAYPTEAGRIIENGVEVEFTESRKVEKGTKITLTAEAKEQGYRFVGWYNSSDQSETLISADATYTFTVDKDMYVYAKFEQIEAGK